MARLPEAPQYGWFAKFMFWVTRRKLGRLPTPSLVVGIHPGVYFGFNMMMLAQQAAGTVEPGLKGLARVQTARLIGCPF